MVANASRTAIRVTKRQLYQDLIRHDIGASVDRFQELLHHMMAGPDFAEGVAALRERRPPEF